MERNEDGSFSINIGSDFDEPNFNNKKEKELTPDEILAREADRLMADEDEPDVNLGSGLSITEETVIEEKPKEQERKSIGKEELQALIQAEMTSFMKTHKDDFANSGDEDKLLKVGNMISERLERTFLPLTESLKPDNDWARPVYPEVVNAEDWLDRPVVFLAYNITHCIWDDFRGGQSIKTPTGSPFKFNWCMTQRISGNTKFSRSIIHLCSCIVYSKSGVEWLKKHSQYNKTFFTDIAKAKTYDNYYGEAYAELSRKFDSWTKDAIIDLAKKRNVPLSTDIEEMRGALIHIFAKERMDTRRNVDEVVSERYEKAAIESANVKLNGSRIEVNS